MADKNDDFANEVGRARDDVAEAALAPNDESNLPIAEP